MAEVSFDTSTEIKQPAAESAPKAELATKAPAHHPVVQSEVNRDSVEGEIDRDDIVTPRLNIVAKVGDLSNQFTPGNFALNRTHDLGNQPLNVVAVYVKKYYREVTDFDDQEANPRIFATSAEVADAGLRVGRPSSREIGEEAAPEATILFFVERPEKLATAEAAEAFDVVLPSGKTGALALYTAAKTSYRGVASVLFTALSQNKHVRENGLIAQQWKLSSTLQKWESKTWFQGGLAPSGHLTPEDAAALKEFALN